MLGTKCRVGVGCWAFYACHSIAEFYGNVNGTPFTAAERGGIEMVRYRSVTNRILTDSALYTFNCYPIVVTTALCTGARQLCGMNGAL